MTISPTIAAKVEQVVANKTEPTISEGFLEPAEALNAISVAGTIVTLDVFIAKKVHIASVAVSGLSFSRCNSCMAFNPKGVAAFPKPSILALKFIKIHPNAGCPFGIEGKSQRKRGAISRLSISISPDSSATLAMPSHKLTMPIRVIALCTALPAAVIAAFVIISILPFAAATIIPDKIKKEKIKFIARASFNRE